MSERRHLLIFDPNPIIKLLHINVNNNYFEFASLTFQQIKGMALVLTNSSYMLVTLTKFLRTQNKQPLLLRYIDIFIIWTHSQKELMNQFKSSLRYTHQYSSASTDIFDLTIYKGSNTKILDTHTPQNLYRYMHYSSNHAKPLFQAIIIRELIRYVTREEQFVTMTKLFEDRLLARAYPKH